MTVVTTNLTDSSGVAVLSGGWEFIETQTASADATIDVINLSSTYFVYKFIWYAIKPSTDAILTMRTTNDNGATWDSSGYLWSHNRVSMEATEVHVATGDNADNEIEMALASGSATNETSDWEITLFNPSGTDWTKIKWEGVNINGTGVGEHSTGHGFRNAAELVNGVRFRYLSGNIFSWGGGCFYGMRNPFIIRSP